MNNTILFVDDDIRVVSAIQRSLYKAYRIEIAGDPKDALDAIGGTTYAVVVSDLRMPGMNGVQFLTSVRDLSPNTVRILLTGQPDLDAAIAAVNDGAIFRFLTKPCPQEILTKTLDAALVQFRLLTAEKDVLRETVMGTVAVLVEILSAIQPIAFGRAGRIREYVRLLAKEMQIPDVWQLETAAMLSQIGCIKVDPDILQRYYAGETLSDDEMAEFHSHAGIGRKLLQKVPRLHNVAQIIGHQHEEFDADASLEPEAYNIMLFAQVLRGALDFDRLIGTEGSPEGALMQIHGNAGSYSPELRAALHRVTQELASGGANGTIDLGETLAMEQASFQPIADKIRRALRVE
jgi:response regulator RpfG family c-di-GMP phosphodiesterase